MTKKRVLILAFHFFLAAPLIAGKTIHTAKKLAPAPPAKSGPEKSVDLEKLLAQVESGLKNSNAKSVAALEFHTLDGRASNGTLMIQKELTEFLKQKGYYVLAKADIDSAAVSLGLEPGPVPKKEAALEIGKKLGVHAVVVGELKDDKSKKRVVIHTLLYQPSSGKVLGGGVQIIPKTWTDPVAGCGAMAYASMAKPVKAGENSPENVQFSFSDIWPGAPVLGIIKWNYCKPGKKNPSLNDALPDLKKKAWEEGGRGLIIDINEPDETNGGVLKIEARVVSF